MDLSESRSLSWIVRSYRRSSVDLVALAVISGLAVTCTAFVSLAVRTPEDSISTRSALLAVGFAAGGVAGIVFGCFLWVKRRSALEAPEDARRRQAANLAAALTLSTDLLESIKRDIEEGERLARDVERRLEASAATETLTSDQVRAVVSHFRSVVGSSARVQLWQNLAMGTLFFALGIVVTVLLSG